MASVSVAAMKIKMAAAAGFGESKSDTNNTTKTTSTTTTKETRKENVKKTSEEPTQSEASGRTPEPAESNTSAKSKKTNPKFKLYRKKKKSEKHKEKEKRRKEKKKKHKLEEKGSTISTDNQATQTESVRIATTDSPQPIECPAGVERPSVDKASQADVLSLRKNSYDSRCSTPYTEISCSRVTYEQTSDEDSGRQTDEFECEREEPPLVLYTPEHHLPCMRHLKKPKKEAKVREQQSKMCRKESSAKTLERNALVVVEFCPNVSSDTVNWLKMRLQSKCGANLRVYYGYCTGNKSLILYLDASTKRLIDTAEAVGLVKWTRNHKLMLFNNRNIDLFMLDGESEEDTLATREKQWLIFYELMMLQGVPQESIVGYEPECCVEYESIVHRCLQLNIIHQIFPLHEELELEQVRCATRCPHGTFKTNLLACYFGPSTASYFLFADVTLMILIVPMLVALMHLYLKHTKEHENNDEDNDDDDDEKGESSDWIIVFAAITNIIFSIVFLVDTGRKLNNASLTWTAITRGAGDIRPHLTTQERRQLQPCTAGGTYPSWQNVTKEFLISFPVILVLSCLVSLVIVALLNSKLLSETDTADDSEELVHGRKQKADEESWCCLWTFEGFVTALFLWISFCFMLIFSRHLTEWERPLLQSYCDISVVWKMFLFFAITCFCTVLYLVIHREQIKAKIFILAVVILFPVLDVIFDTLMCMWTMCVTRTSPDTKDNFPTTFFTTHQVLNIQSIMEETERQRLLFKCDDMVADFISLFVVVAMVLLYSAIVPEIAVVAMIGIIIMLPIKIWRLCTAQQRPLAPPTLNMYSWQIVMELLIILAICTNFLLLNFSVSLKEKFGKDRTTSEWLAIFLVMTSMMMFIVSAIIFFTAPCTELADIIFALHQAEQHEVRAHPAKECRQVRSTSAPPALENVYDEIDDDELPPFTKREDVLPKQCSTCEHKRAHVYVCRRNMTTISTQTEEVPTAIEEETEEEEEEEEEIPVEPVAPPEPVEKPPEERPKRKKKKKKKKEVKIMGPLPPEEPEPDPDEDSDDFKEPETEERPKRPHQSTRQLKKDVRRSF